MSRYNEKGQFHQRVTQQSHDRARLIQQCLADGCSQKELQSQFGLTKAVISTTIERARLRAGAKTTTHWVAMGLRTGEVR